MADPDTEKATLPRVWDVVTRLWHWVIVLAIPTMWWTAENSQLEIHFTIGIGVVGLVVFRLVWGLWGSNTARFLHFIKSPMATIRYAQRLFSKNYKPHFGHNPLGGLSVIAILLSLIVQLGTGLFASDTDGLYSGPLNRFISYELAETVTEIHETSFNVLIALIVLHLGAIAFYLVGKRINLVRPMITGQMNAPPEDNEKAELKKPGLIILLISLAIGAGVSAWLFTL